MLFRLNLERHATTQEMGTAMEKNARPFKLKPSCSVSSLAEGVELKLLPDRISIKIQCPKCGKAINESPGQLAMDLRLSCSYCGNTRYFSRSQWIEIRQEIDEIEQLIAIDFAKKAAKMAKKLAKKREKQQKQPRNSPKIADQGSSDTSKTIPRSIATSSNVLPPTPFR